MTEVVVVEDTLISSHSVQEATGASNRSVGSVDEANGKHQCQKCRARAASGRLEDKFDDGHAS